MRTQEHPHYPNPTIIEAIIEIRFSMNLETQDIEKLEKTFGSKYPLKKDEIIAYSASFNQSGMSLQHDKLGKFRLRFDLGTQMFILIFPDKLSFHWVGGQYPGWHLFQGEFEKFWEKFCKNFPAVISQQIGVRYINKLDKKTIDQKVGFWLKYSTNYPKCILSVQSDYFYRCKWPLKSSRWALVCIAEGEIQDSQRPLMLDIDVVQQIKTNAKDKFSLSNLASELHDEVSHIFESSISANYRKILNTEKRLIK